jgi:uncharacterized protein YbaP (TraB family)
MKPLLAISMKCRPSLVTLVFIIALVVMPHSALRAQQAVKPATKQSLWKVEGRTNAMYLFGSIHFLKKDFYPLPQPIEDAYNQSQVVVFEADLGEMNSPEAQIKMVQSGKAAEGETLKDVLSKETYAKLESHLTESGLPIAVFDPLRPWMVAVALVSTEIMKLGYNPEDGVDKYFFGKVKKDKKEVVALETLDFQLGLFTSLTKQEQDAMLRETLQEISGFKKDLQGIIDAWKTGDTQALDKFMLEAMRDYPQLHKKLLIDRNKQWVDKLQKLHASGKTVLVVVGAAHLVGKDSVVDLLNARGLKARQL